MIEKRGYRENQITQYELF